MNSVDCISSSKWRLDIIFPCTTFLLDDAFYLEWIIAHITNKPNCHHCRSRFSQHKQGKLCKERHLPTNSLVPMMPTATMMQPGQCSARISMIERGVTNGKSDIAESNRKWQRNSGAWASECWTTVEEMAGSASGISECGRESNPVKKMNCKYGLFVWGFCLSLSASLSAWRSFTLVHWQNLVKFNYK